MKAIHVYCVHCIHRIQCTPCEHRMHCIQQSIDREQCVDVYLVCNVNKEYTVYTASLYTM